MKATIKMVAALAVIGFVVAAVAPVLAQQPTGQRVVVEERSAVVLRVLGNTVIIRNDKNEVKQYSNLPEGAVLYVEGKPAKLEDLREGMRIRALRFQDVPPPTIISQSEAEDMGLPAATEPMAAAPPAEAAPEAAAPAPAMAPELPPTGSAWPLLGLIGAVLVLAGLALGTVGRRARA